MTSAAASVLHLNAEKKFLEIKALFEAIIGCSIYDLLPGVVENSFK